MVFTLIKIKKICSKRSGFYKLLHISSFEVSLSPTCTGVNFYCFGDASLTQYKTMKDELKNYTTMKLTSSKEKNSRARNKSLAASSYFHIVKKKEII